MSGEGILPTAVGQHTAADERADVLAYLKRRIANAGTMAEKSPEFADLARERERQLQVIHDEIKAGLHHGSADVERALAGDAVCPAPSARAETPGMAAKRTLAGSTEKDASETPGMAAQRTLAGSTEKESTR